MAPKPTKSSDLSRGPIIEQPQEKTKVEQKNVMKSKVDFKGLGSNQQATENSAFEKSETVRPKLKLPSNWQPSFKSTDEYDDPDFEERILDQSSNKIFSRYDGTDGGCNCLIKTQHSAKTKVDV